MLEVCLFGKLSICLDGQSVEIPSRPMQSLLAYLILNAGTVYRREKLAGHLWPESDEKNARHNLRQTLWRLGKAIGKDCFLSNKVSVGFNPQVDYILDVIVLQNAIPERDPIDQLIRSVSVYTDILLPGFYEDWVLLEQERLQAVYEDRMQMLLDRLSQKGQWRETREWAERWIAQGRVPEQAYRALLMAHAGLGDRAGVRSVYQRCWNALEAEVGVEPSPETQTLFQKITSGQYLPELQNQHSKSHPTVRLPHQPTPFIGRKKELKELGVLLSDPTVRLVNILGPGGIGKTRLAIEAAQAHKDAFIDGVYFVALAALDDPNLISMAIGNAINFSFHVGGKSDKESQNKQLVAYLHDKQMLLLLDNLEHLADGLPLISDLLQSASGVNLLTTSRERLNLRGETLFRVGSMSVPDLSSNEGPNSVETYDALQLFANCAERAQSRFDLNLENLNEVINICRLVDGLPLGIELAAAWVGLLTPEEIAAEIKTSLDFLSSTYDDMPDRQQSIRSVFESSWGRFTEIEQAVFQQLSVFRGGFTRPAAESITGATLQILMALVNKSMVRPDYTGRYYIHELLRQYGSEKLQNVGKTTDGEMYLQMPETKMDLRHEKILSQPGVGEISRKHAAYFADLAELSHTEIRGRRNSYWFMQLEAESQNMRTALVWSLEGDEPEFGLRMIGPLSYFWYYIGLSREHIYWINLALEKSTTAAPTLWAKVLLTAGIIAYNLRELERSQKLLQNALEIFRKLGDELNEGFALAHLSMASLNSSQVPDDILAMAFDGLEIFLRSDHKAYMAMAYDIMGEITRFHGNDQAAKEHYQHSLDLTQETGERLREATLEANLGVIAFQQADYKTAYKRNMKGLTISMEMPSHYRKATHLALIAGPIAALGYPNRAARILSAATAELEKMGNNQKPTDRPEIEFYIRTTRKALGNKTFQEAWREGQKMKFRDAIALALSNEISGR